MKAKYKSKKEISLYNLSKPNKKEINGLFKNKINYINKTKLEGSLKILTPRNKTQKCDIINSNNKTIALNDFHNKSKNKKLNHHKRQNFYINLLKYFNFSYLSKI